MTAKQVLFRTAAREKVLRGATQLAEAVRLTLGPKSKSVLIQNAVSVASVLLLTDATMTEKPEKAAKPEMQAVPEM